MGCCLPLSPANVPNSVLDVEFKIPDCNVCKRTMTDTISKFKGVTSCVTDTENQKIVVTGSFNQEKLLKKLMMKVIGKEVKIVVKNEKDDESEIVPKIDEIIPEKIEESEIVQKSDEIIAEKIEESEMVPEEVAKAEKIIEPNSDEHKELEKIMIFSEENPNARCSIS